MKGILVILDGIGDLPHSLLDGKTPLEAAYTPNLDYLSSRGELGQMFSVKEGFVPQSDEAIVSIFGNKLMASSRGQLEASGAGLELKRGDLALRVNFATIDNFKNGNIVDRRAGRTLTTDEAKKLADALNGIKMPLDFEFVSTVQHRAVLVFRGGFSENISGNDKTYSNGKATDASKISVCRPLDDDENSQYSANVVNEFLEKAYEILENHPINKERVRRGLLPANFLLVRSAGVEVPKLKQYPNWISLGYMPLEIGFSKLSAMNVYGFDYPKMKKLDVYENLHDGLKKACKYAIKTIRKNYKKYDYAYIHIKETDLPGHDNKPFEKKGMIEYIDKVLFNFLRKFSMDKEIKIVVTGDHSTPCKLKAHSADPIPVLVYNSKKQNYSEKRFCEKDAANGSLGEFNGENLFKKAGFK